MIWQDPSMLWLLWLIPLVAAAIWLNRWRQEKRLASFFDQRLINQLRRRYWEPGQRMRVVLLLTALFFFTVGLAGPSIGTEVREIEQRGLDMMVVLDLSRSMNAEDIRPSRLEKAKFEIQRLIQRSRGDRIGLIVFTGEAFVQSPVTNDQSALRMFLDIAETHQMPSTTTSFRAALEQVNVAFERMEMREAARVVLIISDGEDHGPSFDEVLEALTEQGVRIYTAGIGTRRGGRIPVYSPDGNEFIGYHRNRQGQEVTSSLEQETLQQIARQGNGEYFEISSSTSGLDPFLSRLDELQRGEFATEEYADYRNRYQLMLGIGLIFLLAGLVVPGSRSDQEDRLVNAA